MFRGDQEVPTPDVNKTDMDNMNDVDALPAPGVTTLGGPPPGIWPPCTPVRIPVSARGPTSTWTPDAPSPSSLANIGPSASTVSDILKAAAAPSSEDLVQPQQDESTVNSIWFKAASTPAPRAASTRLGWRARDDTNYTPTHWRFRPARPKVPDAEIRNMILGHLSAYTPAAAADTDVSNEDSTPATVADPSPTRTEANEHTLVHQATGGAQPKDAPADDCLRNSGETVMSVAIAASRSPIWKGVRRFRSPSHGLGDNEVTFPLGD